MNVYKKCRVCDALPSSLSIFVNEQHLEKDILVKVIWMSSLVDCCGFLVYRSEGL